MSTNSNMISESIQRLSNTHSQHKFIKLSSVRFVKNISKLINKQKKKKTEVTSCEPNTASENLFIDALQKGIIEGITYQGIIDFLMLPKYDRKLSIIKTIGEFFSSHYSFFSQLYNTSQEKVYAIINVLNIEKYNEHEAIIRYGEEGNKFYIILKGSVGVYKPRTIQKSMYPKNFVKCLQMIKYIERDEGKLKRLESGNYTQYDIDKIKQMNYNYKKFSHEKNKIPFYLEIEEKIDENREGHSFGELALLQKTKRSATIRALEDNCIIASITKSEYNKIIRQLEAKAFDDRIEEFKRNFGVLKNWTKKSIIKLFNIVIKKTCSKGDYLYHQGSNDSNIYFVLSGSFDIYLDMYYKAFDSYMNYIQSSKTSIIPSIRQKTAILSAGGIEAYLNRMNKKKNRYPIDFNSNRNQNYMFHDEEDELCKLKIKEEITMDPNKLFRIKIRNSYENEIFGLSESLELKQRFVSVVCNTSARVYVLKLFDLMSLLINRDVQLGDIERIITEKKEVLINCITRIVSEQKRVISRQLKDEFDKIMNTKRYSSYNNENSVTNSMMINIKNIKHQNIALSKDKKSNKSFSKVKSKINLKRNQSLSYNQPTKILSEYRRKTTYMSTPLNNLNKFKVNEINNKKLFTNTELINVENELFKIPGIFTTDRFTRPRSHYSIRKEDLFLLRINTDFNKRNDIKNDKGISYSLSSNLLNTTINSNQLQQQNGLKNHSLNSSLYLQNKCITYQGDKRYFSAKTQNRLIKTKPNS